MIDDDICNRKTEFKAKSETMKMKRNYKKLTRKYGESSNVKRFSLRNFLYKVLFVQFSF